jgi:hypothetical protein
VKSLPATALPVPGFWMSPLIAPCVSTERVRHGSETVPAVSDTLEVAATTPFASVNCRTPGLPLESAVSVGLMP